MPGTNGCRKCFEQWNVCECPRELDAGELRAVELVRLLGGAELWRRQWREDRGLPVVPLHIVLLDILVKRDLAA